MLVNYKNLFKRIFDLKEKFYISSDISKNDPEKAVIPTILYLNTNHKFFGDLRKKGFVFVIGWWHFSIKFGYIENK